MHIWLGFIPAFSKRIAVHIKYGQNEKSTKLVGLYIIGWPLCLQFKK